MRRGLVLAGVTLAVGLVVAANASAATWSVSKLGAGPVGAAFYGVSCPSSSLCVAVGGNNTIAASSNPTGGASAWDVGHPGGSFEPPFPGGDAIFGGAQIRGVSCPSTGLCVAVSFQGNIYSTTEPAGDPTGWKVLEQGDGPNIHMTGISCPTASFCVAVGYAGKVLTTGNPTGEGPDWKVTSLPRRFDFRAVSCPSAALCVATGNEGQIVVSTDPTGGPGAWQTIGAPIGEEGLDGVSCPTTSLCVTGGAGPLIVSSNPTGGASSWNVVPAGTGLPISSVSCPSNRACAAFDNNADVLTSTDPTGGAGAWSFENLVPYGSPDGNGTFGVSCPTTSFCAAVGQQYMVLTSTDPFARKGTVGGKGLRLPRAVITRHPAKRLQPRRGGVEVGFRFRALGSAVGFQCKVDTRRFRPCKSPRRYRLGRGKHVFRVRAIAPSGAKGPRASFHFRVGTLIERSTVGTCKPGQEGNRKPCLGSA